MKPRLLAPLYISSLMLMLLVVGQGCLSIFIGARRQQAAAWVTHTLLVEREEERLLSAALEQQTGLRGYMLTRDRTFLESYRAGRVAFHHRLNHLDLLVQDNLAQQSLNQARILHGRWQSQYAQRVISGSVNQPTLLGRTLFDSFRTQVRALLKREEILLNNRNRQLQQLYRLHTLLDILSTGVILAGVGLNLWLLYRRVQVPLQRLTAAGQAWRAGRMEARLDYVAADEIGRLAEVLDAMAAEIHQRQQRKEARNQQLENLISALSHDLRTPLLATRTMLRSILGGAFGPVNDTWQEVLAEYRQANEELLKLVEALLEVPRYEAGGGKHLSREPLNWEKIFQHGQTQINAVANHECTCTWHIAPALPAIYGDELAIQRVVLNLLDNAVRVSLGQPIKLAVIPLRPAVIRVAVHDQGPGIALQKQQRLFRRFSQGRCRRGRAGLGFYLCCQIVEAHGGSINAESTKGRADTTD